MKTPENKIFYLALVAIISTGYVTSGLAISSSDVNVEIQDPTEGEEVQTAIFGDSVDYEIDLENNFENDTVVDYKLTFTDSDGNTYSKWYNGTTVQDGVTETESVEYAPNGYTPNEENYESVSVDVDATFAEENNESETTMVSDSVGFDLKENKSFGTIMIFIVVIALVGVMTSAF